MGHMLVWSKIWKFIWCLVLNISMSQFFILITHNSQFLTQFTIPFLFLFLFFLFLILTQILVWNPNFELSFWFVKSKLNKTQTMGTMSKRLPNTHISSTHKPNKEKKKAKVKREREKNEERICVVSNQSFIVLLFWRFF